MSSLFAFDGRLGRLAYLGYFVLWMLVGLVAILAAQLLGGVLGLLLAIVVAFSLFLIFWPGTRERNSYG